MSSISGLRSPYEKIGRLVYFGRMIDKIRLHAAGKLPADYVSNLGDNAAPGMFDGRCCRFLGVKYADLAAHVAACVSGGSPADDEKILAWAHAHGAPRTDEECDIWNQYMAKLGWRDKVRARVEARVAEAGAALAGKKIETFFDYIDADEGRDPAAERLWGKI